MDAQAGSTPPRPKIPPGVLLGISMLLLTQFLLGITVNLFVAISKTHPGAGLANYFIGAPLSVGWAIAHKWPYLSLHELLGLGLVIGSFTGLVLGLVGHAPGRIVVWNFINVFGIWFAAGNGMYFLIHPSADWASMLMATGFAIGLGSVIVLIYLLGRLRVTPPG